MILLIMIIWWPRPPPTSHPAFGLPIGQGAMRDLMGSFHKAKWQPLRCLAGVWGSGIQPHLDQIPGHRIGPGS